ncbi:AMP-binding protein [Achromobacter xylosoxidans]
MQPGQRVAIWLPNCAAWVESFLACARLGALALAVNTRFRALEVADILGRGKADWLIFWPGFKGIDFQGVLDDVP